MKIKIKKKLTESRKDNITTEILKNDSNGYKSFITMKLDDRTIYQELSIEKFKTKVYRDSEGLNKLQKCYPSTFQKYPPEIRKLKPWNINGNSGPGRTVVNFYTQGGPFITTYNIDFRIVNVESSTGEDFSDLDIYDEGIFGKNKLAAMSFYREVMKQIGEYVKNNPWMIYYFFGIETDEELDAEFSEETENKRTKLYLLSLKRLQRILDGEWVVTYPEKGNPNSIMFFKCPVSELQEIYSMGRGAVQGFGAPFSKEEEKLIQELYSTSGAMMGAGSGQIPKERNPEAHKRYVRIRFTRQGLQNFKPSPYFPDREQQLGEEWSKDERKKRKSKCSNPKGFTMKQFCKNQRTRSKKGQKKNENKN